MTTRFGWHLLSILLLLLVLFLLIVLLILHIGIGWWLALHRGGSGRMIPTIFQMIWLQTAVSTSLQFALPNTLLTLRGQSETMKRTGLSSLILEALRQLQRMSHMTTQHLSRQLRMYKMLLIITIRDMQASKVRLMRTQQQLQIMVLELQTLRLLTAVRILLLRPMRTTS